MDKVPMNSSLDKHEFDYVLDLQSVPGMDPPENFSDSWCIDPTENILLNAEAPLAPEAQNAGFRSNVPSATCVLPSVSPLVGDYNFAARIHPEGPDCLYSAELNKIFVNINKNVPVQFKLNLCVTDLYIRALPVYVSSNDQQHVVKRCLTHEASDKLEGKDVELANHVLRCTSTNAATYYTDVDSGRLSVSVPVEGLQSGMDYFTVSYQFTCLNSCQNGINRRPMGVIFTLENEIGDVLGREFMNVRVCSCPKRDKDKEEEKKDKGKAPNNKSSLKTVSNDLPKTEPEEFVTLEIKACHMEELAKLADGLIFRDVGIQQRQLTDQETSLVAMYQRIIEAPDDEMLEGRVCIVHPE